MVQKFNRVCPKCGKEFVVVGTQSEFDKGKLRRFCSRSCANSRTHNEKTKAKTSEAISRYYKTHKYPTGFYVQVKTYHCKQCGKPFTMKDNRDTGGRKYCSSKCREIWMRNNVYNKAGGYREKSGRGKSGWYKGIYCSSTWELAFVIYHLDHNIPIYRCTQKFKYIYNGVWRTYHPDFIVNNQIIEIKGYVTEQWKEKQRQNPTVITLFEKDIKKYIDYVKDNYTNNLSELYDNSKPEDKQNRKYYWVHKGSTSTMVTPENLDKYLNDNWIKGRALKR
jgi:endogenous inhibitor of DNA gyrase (YacG/DUF329 family)